MLRRALVSRLAAPDGMDPAEDPVRPFDLHATICHALGIDLSREITTKQGRPMRLLRKDGKPIKQLFA